MALLFRKRKRKEKNMKRKIKLKRRRKVTCLSISSTRSMSGSTLPATLCTWVVRNSLDKILQPDRSQCAG